MAIDLPPRPSTMGSQEQRPVDRHAPDTRRPGLPPEIAPWTAVAGDLRADRRSHRLAAWALLTLCLLGAVVCLVAQL